MQLGVWYVGVGQVRMNGLLLGKTVRWRSLYIFAHDRFCRATSLILVFEPTFGSHVIIRLADHRVSGVHSDGLHRASDVVL